MKMVYSELYSFEMIMCVWNFNFIAWTLLLMLSASGSSNPNGETAERDERRKE